MQVEGRAGRSDAPVSARARKFYLMHSLTVSVQALYPQDTIRANASRGRFLLCGD
jgi:hypothetical protein